MREIKFRAWHKNAKCMCENATTDLLDRDYLEFMQYTGLKDKNGTEIYEGDIVQFKNSFGGLTGVVRYYANCKPIIDKNKRSVDIAECNEEDLEVIGNIYQNPELLKED